MPPHIYTHTHCLSLSAGQAKPGHTHCHEETVETLIFFFSKAIFIQAVWSMGEMMCFLKRYNYRAHTAMENECIRTTITTKNLLSSKKFPYCIFLIAHKNCTCTFVEMPWSSLPACFKAAVISLWFSITHVALMVCKWGLKLKHTKRSTASPKHWSLFVHPNSPSHTMMCVCITPNN